MNENTKLMSGNEAIAQGAWEAGVRVGSGYPGTPSTEILENLCKHQEVKCEWSVNEKVGFEVGIGACFEGVRSIVTMKHVGLNVAADPLFTAAYTGVNGGLVIVTADDPAMHSSQNEQDNRHYARAAKLPMLEPSDSQEAKDFTIKAFEISEKFDTPVLLRPVTRISHSMGLVECGDRKEHEITGFDRNVQKYVMIPAHARGRHVAVEKRLIELEQAVASLGVNRIENMPSEGRTGIVTAGTSYTYVKEVFPDMPVFKLGMAFPLPAKELQEFCGNFDEIIVVEELEPFIENYLKTLGIKTRGKDELSLLGEYSPEMLRNAFQPEAVSTNPVPELPYQLPPRPPSLCKGCPHRTVFGLLHDAGVTVSGDIGCYSLGVLPPFSAMHTLVDMGASITVAQGMEMAGAGERGNKVVSVIGDSTFAHSGITGLVNAAYNDRKTLIIVLDNSTTAMTGMQPNPLSGENIYHNPSWSLDYQKLGEAAGLKSENIKIVDAYNKPEVEAMLNELLERNELALMVVKGPCLIYKRKHKKSGRA